MRSAPRPITSVPGVVRRRNGAGVGRVYPLFQMPKGSVMTRLPIAALVAAIAAPVLAAKPADRFIDDRSSPARVITSLYNAIDRHEYLRAWSYNHEAYRDYLPIRIAKQTQMETRERPAPLRFDTDWNSLVRLWIRPRSDLSDAQARAVRLEYGFDEKTHLLIETRKALEIGRAHV